MDNINIFVIGNLLDKADQSPVARKIFALDILGKDVLLYFSRKVSLRGKNNYAPVGRRFR